jgi:sodium-dependent phosphate cotransporter
VFTATLLIFFEFQFGFLSHISTWLGHITYTSMGNNSLLPFFQDGFLKPISVYIIKLIGISWLTVIIGFTGMYVTIKGFVKLFTSKDLDKDSSIVNKYIFAQGYKTFFTGLVTTAIVHSSSATISILQSFTSSYKISTRKAFYFIVGANIGTTFTALLAGLFNKETALCLAFAHLLFNLIGALAFGPIPWLRNINIVVAEFLAEYFEKYRSYLIIYISFLFFIIPLLLICFF